jgi:hypothetical protein
MSKQYLILIEQLVREGRSEREIDRVVRQVVNEDERVEETASDDEPERLPHAA